LGLATETDGKKGTKQAIQSKKAELESLFKGDTGEIYKNWLESHKDAMDGWHNENIPQGTYDDQKQSHGSQSADAKIDEMGIRRRDRRDRLDPEGKYGDKFDFHETGKTPEGGQPPTGTGAKPEKGTKMGKIMETTDVNDLHDRGRGETIRNRDRNTGAAHDIKRKAELEALFKGEYRELVKAKAFRKLKPVYEGDTKESTVKSDVDKGKRDVAAGYRVHTDTGEASHCGGNKKCERAHGIRCTIDGCEKIIPERMGDVREHWAEHEAENKFLDSEQDKLRDRMSKEGKLKSDVEHGKYGNVGREPNIAVSTDTKVDVPESTGYEERPHISVEEAGKLPRATFNPHGNDELHVRGSQDSKDQPKFNQPVSQNQPVRKVGAPEQHPNSYGVRYGMKGGVKKVWCPEHQVWEETTKDWHE
jgi:hypothetical protein